MKTVNLWIEKNTISPHCIFLLNFKTIVTWPTGVSMVLLTCSEHYWIIRAYPLRKFEQFPAQKMYQNLRWPAQILARSPRWTSAIPALVRASLAPSAGEMDELFMAAEQKTTVKKFKNIFPHCFVRFFSLPHPALPYLRFSPCLPPQADWLLWCMRWYSYVHCGCVLLLVGVSIY